MIFVIDDIDYHFMRFICLGNGEEGIGMIKIFLNDKGVVNIHFIKQLTEFSSIGIKHISCADENSDTA